MITHREKKPFECNVEGCGKSYCDARSLRRHQDNHHSSFSSTTSSTTSSATTTSTSTTTSTTSTTCLNHSSNSSSSSSSSNSNDVLHSPAAPVASTASSLFNELSCGADMLTLAYPTSTTSTTPSHYVQPSPEYAAITNGNFNLVH